MASFTVTGSLAGYTTAPTLQYQDDAGSWQALPSGATITSSGFSFVHPTITVVGNHTVSVRDADAPSVVGSSGAFPVTTTPSVTPTPSPVGGTPPFQSMLGIYTYPNPAGVTEDVFNGGDSNFHGFQVVINDLGLKPRFRDEFDQHNITIMGNHEPNFNGQWPIEANGRGYGTFASLQGVVPVQGFKLVNGWSGQDSYYTGIINGTYDGQLQGAVACYAHWGNVPLVWWRPGYEFNGTFMEDCYTYISGDQHGKFKAAFQRIYTVLHNASTTNQNMVVWNPSYINYNANDGADIEDLFPGAAYVDAVGIDAYSPCWNKDLANWDSPTATTYSGFAPNQATWMQSTTNRQHFWNYPSDTQYSAQAGRHDTAGTGVMRIIDIAAKYGKPICFPECGSGAVKGYPDNGYDDDTGFIQWLHDTIVYAASRGVQTVFCNFWDIPADDINGRFDSGYGTQPNVRALIRRYWGAG